MSTALHRSVYIHAVRDFIDHLTMAGVIKFEVGEEAKRHAIELGLNENRRLRSPHAALIEIKAVTDEQLINHFVSDLRVPLIDLSGYEIPEDLRKNLDLEASWASLTFPFDLEEGYHFVVTAYPKVPFIETFWQGKLQGPILWHVAPNDHIAELLEKFEAERTQK